MPKPTLQIVADELGVDVSQVKRASKEGINPYDRESLKRHLANGRSYTPRQKPDDQSAPADDSGVRMTIEEIEDYASRKGQTKRDVEVYKVQLEVIRVAQALKIQRNQLLSRSEVEERDTRIAAALGAMMKRYEREIPAACLGLPLSQSLPIAKDKARALQAMLSDMFSEFWRDHPES